MTLRRAAGRRGRRRPRHARPTRPGSTPEALLRALELSIARQIRGLVTGDYRARDLGGGTELAQVRPYEAGDDVRRIDWNVTARMNQPHVRVHVPERALTTWLLLDSSPSMQFGTADRRKADVAEGVSIAMAHLSAQRGNRLGVMTFGGRNDVRIEPRTGRRRCSRRSSSRARRRPSSPATEPAPRRRAHARGGTALRRPGHAPGWPGRPRHRPPRPLDWLPQLGAVAQRHAVLVVEIRDPREDELPDVGDLTLVDAETGREVRVDTSSARLRPGSPRPPPRPRAVRTSCAGSASSRRPVHVRQLAALARRPAPSPGDAPMTFADPAFLAALLLVPIALGAYLLVQRRRQRYVVRFTNVDLLTNLVPRTPGLRRHVPTALYLGAIAFLAIALARPSMTLRSPARRRP